MPRWSAPSGDRQEQLRHAGDLGEDVDRVGLRSGEEDAHRRARGPERHDGPGHSSPIDLARLVYGLVSPDEEDHEENRAGQPGHEQHLPILRIRKRRTQDPIRPDKHAQQGETGEPDGPAPDAAGLEAGHR